MKRQFIAKLNKDNKEVLVVTDGTKFGILQDITGLDQLLKLEKKEIVNLIDTCLLAFPLEAEPNFLPIIENQFVFATGVTYSWSKEKLDSISETDLYKKLYLAKRPMFFIKGLKENIALNNECISLREDVRLNIPEGEIVAVYNSYGENIGFSLGNDQTALDFEKENPLYQLQAKFFHHSSSLLPLIYISDELPTVKIKTEVFRADKKIVSLQYGTENFIRSISEIGKYLFELKIFQRGAFLFLGCGVSYPKDLPLEENDIVEISSELFPIKLVNKCKKL